MLQKLIQSEIIELQKFSPKNVAPKVSAFNSSFGAAGQGRVI